jgi:hypothetical protein
LICEEVRKGYVVIFCILFRCVSVVLWRVLFGVQGHEWLRDFQAPFIAKGIGHASVGRTIMENVVNV